MAMKSGNKDQIKTELDRQVEVYNAFVKAKHPDESEQKCANMTAELVAETGMAWHLEAVGSGGVRGTGDQKTMTLAAYLYKKVIDNFTPQEFAKFEFPRIVKDDWPTIFKIKYAMADLLYFQQRWAECGPAFDAVVAEASEVPGGARSRLRRGALLPEHLPGPARRQERPQGHAGNLPGRGSRQERRRRPKRTRSSSPSRSPPTRRACSPRSIATSATSSRKEGDKQALDQYVEVKYARARTYFEAQHWEEAALGFRDVAVDLPRQGRRHLRGAALPRVAQRARHPHRAAEARVLRLDGAATSRSSSSSTAKAQTSRRTKSSAPRSPRFSATSSA